ncbi:ATP-grasp domain-containing protein [Actinopolyspora sp. H202]|uniref:ATP-grasp domain-containing protein n=1 Tax=Actinopolyspora sp. H202 TaxID=1500456 RepID=UPI003EE681B0
MSELVVVEAFGSGNGLALLRSAVETGAATIFATSNLGRYQHDLDRQILENPPSNLTIRSGVDTTNVTAVTELLRTSAADAGVLAQVDRTISTVSQACAVTGHSFLPPEVVQRCTDKSVFRDTLAIHDLPGPRTMTASSTKDLEIAAETLGIPVIVKPARGTGSVGVRLAHTSAEIVSYGTNILADSPTVLIESYLVGPLISVETLRRNGETIVLGTTDRALSDPPWFAELGWTFPLLTTSEIPTSLIRLTESVLDALGLENGPAHLEFVETENGLVPIEVNPRFAGRGLTRMVSRLSGIDEYASVVRQALGDTTPVHTAIEQGYLSEHVIAGPSGTRISDELVRTVSQLPGIEHVRLGDPDHAPPAHHDFCDLGEVLAHGTSAIEAQMRARAAAQALGAACANYAI